jgi:hypothetical protein
MAPDSCLGAHLLVRRLRLCEDVGVQAEATAAAVVVLGRRLRRGVIGGGRPPLFLFETSTCEGQRAGACQKLQRGPRSATVQVQ